MNEKKLNIGCGEEPYEEYVNIDDFSDVFVERDSRKAYYERTKEKGRLLEKETGEKCEVLMMDGNNMSFEDEEFDYIESCSCVGRYVTNYAEVLRVLKKGGRVWIDVWGDKLGDVLFGLIMNGVKITRVELNNGSFDADPVDTSFEIEGTKEGEKKIRRAVVVVDEELMNEGILDMGKVKEIKE